MRKMHCLLMIISPRGLPASHQPSLVQRYLKQRQAVLGAQPDPSAWEPQTVACKDLQYWGTRELQEAYCYCSSWSPAYIHGSSEQGRIPWDVRNALSTCWQPLTPQSPRFTTGRDTQQVCAHPVLSTKNLAMEQQLAFWGILGNPPFNLFSTS